MARSQAKILALLAVMLSCVGLLAPSFVNVPLPRGVTELAPGSAQTASLENLRGSTPRNNDTEYSSPSFQKFSSAVLCSLAVLIVALVPLDEAKAVKSGGRIGGTAQSSQNKQAPPRPSRPAVSNRTTIINKTTVVQAPPPPPPIVVAPPPVIVAPPVESPFGFGMAAAPVVVAPPPTIGEMIAGAVVGSAINSAVNGAINGGNRGPTSTDRMLENQQRQDERQMDRQASELEMLKNELNDLKAGRK